MHATQCHLWIVSQKLYKNSSDISDRAVEIATQKAPHDSNFSLIRSWNPEIAFHLVGLVVQISEISVFCIFVHDGTNKVPPEMGLNIGFGLVLTLEAIKSLCLLVKS